MNMRERIEASARRAGMPSQEAIAQACGVTQPAVFALLSGTRPMKALLAKIAEVTGVSEHWLRDGGSHDAPEWARDPLLLAMADAQEAVRRLQAVTAERDQLRQELAEAKEALAKLALRIADEPAPVRQAAAPRTGYRIGQTKAPAKVD